MKRIWLLVFFAALACFLYPAEQPKPVRADGVCYNSPPPSPWPHLGFLSSCIQPTPFVPASPTPAPTQPYSVILTSPLPVPVACATAGCPTPIPAQTDLIGNTIGVTPINISTPMSISVAATACPGNCATFDVPYDASGVWGITGLTGTGATVTFKYSNDNITYGSAYVVKEISGTLSTTTTSDGNYTANAGIGRYMSLQVTTAGTGTMSVTFTAKKSSTYLKVICVGGTCPTPIPYPTNSNGVLKTAYDNVNDPCSVPANYVTIPFNNSGTDAVLVAHSGSTKIYICAFTINNAVATGNTRLRYGTQTTTPCDTGGVNLYNSGLAVDGANYSNGGWPQFQAVPANNDLCITFTGTGGVAAGSVTYVQI